jgi:tetratricopeptide (TPR) repeat protein
VESAPAVPAAQPPERARPPGDAREQGIASLLSNSAAPAAHEPFTLARTPDRPRVPTEVISGYAALRSGNLADARRSYLAAVGSDPANLDAQLGLATVDARSGSRAAAALHYRKALELDPRNGTALAGLAALADTSRPEALESQLRTELARNPQSAALQFTLGNLYAAQARWSEAQAAFFEAHRLDPGNGDIAYNLAVSLDNLGQSRPAAEFYRRALEAARSQAALFDPAPVTRRLAELPK